MELHVFHGSFCLCVFGVQFIFADEVFAEELVEAFHVIYDRSDFVVLGHPFFVAFQFFQDGFRALRVAPEGWVQGELFFFLDFHKSAIDVKDTS